MFKRIAVVAALLLGSFSLFAQDVAPGSTNSTPVVSKPARDFVMLQFGYQNWINKPDSVKLKGFNYTFSLFLCYDFPIQKSNFSFAAGLGINANVIYLDHQILRLGDSAASGAQATFLPDTVNYKRFKFATTYLTAPFELRYFGNKLNRNRGVKAAIGLQIGTLLGAHTKGLRSVNGGNIKDKESTKNFIATWNFAATARVGWGHFALYGSYNLTNVFKQNYGPDVTPYSIGIVLTGL
ncbi:MAG: outer membrane beta-barrel protein [Taibaiella sp.]|nr:outer membrane beta-barrel protein [Taibaiella sp.]